VIKLEDKDKVVVRLQTVDGHLKCIIHMLEANRSTTEVLTQLNAVQAALGKINALVYNREVDAFAQKMHNNATEQERWQVAQELLDLFRVQLH
jgi:DNA-binding FrmR family transcriptional regulator